MPHMSDAARKRILADWVVKMKKQVVKLYAVAKWSRDADTVQKCMVRRWYHAPLSFMLTNIREHHRVPHEPEPPI